MGDMICFSFVTVLYFFLSWKRGTFAPHISFSLAREKETCRSPRQVPRFARLRSETRLRAQARHKEKERWERLSWRKLLLFRLCSMSWKRVPWCYADWFHLLRRCRWRGGRIAFLRWKSGFHSESRLMYLFNFCCCRALVLFCLCFDLFQ